jgi:hypothetical protein
VKLRINEDQIKYAWYLDDTHGRAAALSYLKLVTRPGYLHHQNIDKAKASVAISMGHSYRNPNVKKELLGVEEK